jgi:iron complex transport system ATP-binding protein
MTIRIENLSFSFGDRQVLRDVSTRLEQGEFVALLGANGAGKTTLLRLIAGELRSDVGAVRLEESGASTATRDGDLAGNVTYLPQRLPTPPYLSVRDLVAMARYRGPNSWGWRPSNNDRNAVEMAMVRCEIEGFADRPFEQHSGGEAQRVWLAFCLAQQRRYIIMDEPLGELDFRSRRNLISLLSRVPKDEGRGALIATHEIGLASEFADRAVVLREGRSVWDAPAPDPDHLAELLSLGPEGSPPA